MMKNFVLNNFSYNDCSELVLLHIISVEKNAYTVPACVCTPESGQSF